MSCAAVARGGAAERGELELQRADLGPQHGRALRVRLHLLGVAPRGARRLALDAAQLAVRLGQLPPRVLELRALLPAAPLPAALGCRGELRLESSQRRLQPRGAGESGCAEGEGQLRAAGGQGRRGGGGTGRRALCVRAEGACGPCVWAYSSGPTVAGLS